MTTTTVQDRHRRLLQVTTDVTAWLNAHPDLIEVYSVDITCYSRPAFAAQVHIHTNLTRLTGLLAAIPQAAVTAHATNDGVHVKIAFTTGADSLIVLLVLFAGEEARALADTAGLAYPARPEQAAITTDTLAAAAAGTTTGQADHG
ncbi:hypothetical protein N8J89_12835 [Crossiella sp. CA-258035]|uniref:hypothetical protein n=1 Tax=Crossiella sp. CA-258035 TaxID=2981138 RepID=UPI0024BD5148|nr:hypothetical protein [Crossiella sp. CA-258035]WHT21906.1 hypothetical protein N8J89_12835 [Crossiella sp. CA-258035]